MEQKPKHSSRRKFFRWGLGIVAAVASVKLFNSSKKKTTTVKMLTQDGQLVEVDAALIKKNGKKISNDELHNWIKNKPTN